MTTINKFFQLAGFTAAGIAASSLLLSSAPAQAAQLVTNGDFATGNLSGWANTGNVSVPTVLSTFGINIALLGSGSGSLYQNLTTVSGASYTLDYDFGAAGLAGNPSFQAIVKSGSSSNTLSNFGPGIASTISLIPPSVFKHYTLNFTGSGNDQLLFQFSNVNQASPLAIDNITVNGPKPTAAPEPFTIVGTLIGGSAAMRMRKKLTLSKSQETV
jgi:hypothetical protein